MLTVLGGTAALMLFVPLIEFIAQDPQGAVRAVQPMVILFMGSLNYAAFLATLMWVAASLVRDWQAALRECIQHIQCSSTPLVGSRAAE